MQLATFLDINIFGLKGMHKLMDLEISEQINEHAKAQLRVYIEPDWDREQFCKDNAGADVCIEVKGTVVFCGYVSQLHNIHRDEVDIYEVELSSYSLKLDYREKSRSYQDVSASYEGVAKQALGDYDSAYVAWQNSGGEKIGLPVFQYAETDWQFIKRLASMHGKSIIVNVYKPQPYLMIDMANYAKRTESDYRYVGGGLTEKGLYTYHEIECGTDYTLGSELTTLEGSFRIVRKCTRMVEGELRFGYCLAEEGAMSQREIRNKNLTGLQLAGTVAEVMEDKVKVSLDMDAEWGGKAEYFFDWKTIASNIMYAMPEKEERVHLRLGDVRGQMASVINCMRQNGDTCPDTSDNTCKLMQYENKSMRLATDRIDFSSISEKTLQAALRLIDVEGIFAQVLSQMNMTAKGAITFHSVKGMVTVDTPFQIVLRDAIGDSDAELAINQTIDFGGDVVKVKAEGRIEYPAIADAPVEIKKDWDKLKEKALMALNVVLVAAVAAAVVAVAAAIAVSTGGVGLGLVAVAAKAATFTIGSALLAGVVTATLVGGAQGISDCKNGVSRELSDYLYQGVDNLCTGAILAAPLAVSLPVSWALVPQLIGVGICSYVYQATDKKLDEKYGGDFYDEDSHMLLNIVFDIALAGIGDKLSKWLGDAATEAAARLSKGLPKGVYISWAKIANKYCGKNYHAEQAYINKELKPAFVGIKSVVDDMRRVLGRFFDSNFVTYVLLGGTDDIPGADLIASEATEPEVNPRLKKIMDVIEDAVIQEEYEEWYNDYSRITYDKSFEVIDFDEDGNLVFE